MIKIKVNCQINNKYNKKMIIEIFEDEEYISYENIKTEFYNNLINDVNFLNKINIIILEKKDIIFDYIRYFDNNIDGWLLLKNEYLLLNDKEMNLLIKANIKTENQKDLISQYIDIKKNIENLTNSTKIIKNKEIINNDSEIDISVLTANPLIEIKYNKLNNI